MVEVCRMEEERNIELNIHRKKKRRTTKNLRERNKKRNEIKKPGGNDWSYRRLWKLGCDRRC